MKCCGLCRSVAWWLAGGNCPWTCWCKCGCSCSTFLRTETWRVCGWDRSGSAFVTSIVTTTMSEHLTIISWFDFQTEQRSCQRCCYIKWINPFCPISIKNFGIYSIMGWRTMMLQPILATIKCNLDSLGQFLPTHTHTHKKNLSYILEN